MKQPCGYLLTREGGQGWQRESRTARGGGEGGDSWRRPQGRLPDSLPLSLIQYYVSSSLLERGRAE